jgi:hypothetical protein
MGRVCCGMAGRMIEDRLALGHLLPIAQTWAMDEPGRCDGMSRWRLVDDVSVR